MSDRATPNLPSRDFDVTERFYTALGFIRGWRDDGWMILDRGELKLEFFPYPDLDPATSSFSCCLRLGDLAEFYAVCGEAGIAETCWGQPRMSPPKREPSGLDIAYLVDPDGSLIRMIQNR